MKENRIVNADQRQQIRLNPDMYGGTRSNPNHTIQEAFDNAIDQVLLGHANHIVVALHSDGSASVMDNGAGIPFSMSKTVSGETMPTARMAWTVPNTSSHYGQKATTSIGKNGVGMKYTSATSTWFVGESWRDNKYYRDEYETLPMPESDDDYHLNPIVYKTPLEDLKGQPFESAPYGFTSGTRVRFLPNDNIYESITFDKTELKNRLHQQTFLNPKLRVTFIDEIENTAVSYYEPEGLKDYIRFLAQANLTTDIYEFEQRIDLADDNFISAKIALAYAETDNKLVSFVNSVRTPDDGTHVTGFYSGWSKLMNDYTKKFNLSKDPIESRDFKPGLIAVVSAFHTSPTYVGQTKDKLANSDASNAVSKIVREAGRFALDRNPKDVETIIKRALEIATFRKKVDDFSASALNTKENKRAVAKKIAGASVLGLTDKKGNKISTELFAVEGKSAGGGVERKRINNKKRGLFQAVLPLRGKVISSFNNTPDKILANEEIANIIIALGCGIGKEYDERKLNYDKFIITTDADVDGSDIYLLLLTFFAEFMPDFIKNGHLYRTITPLYVNKMSKNKKDHVYTYTEIEQKEFLTGNKPIKIERNKGLGELEDFMVTETICEPDTRRLLQILPDDFDEFYEQLKLFKGGDVPPRREYIENHSHLYNFENAD